MACIAAQPWARADGVDMVELGGLWVHRSLPALFQHKVAERPHAVGAYRRVGERWRGQTAAQAARRVERLALGLMTLGVAPGDRVGLLAQTSPEWGLVDFAILHTGGATVGIYPTLVARDVAYQLEHAGVEVAVLDDAAQLEKVLAAREALPRLRAVVLIDAPPDLPGDEEGPAAEGLEVLTLAELEERGAEQPSERFEAAWRAVGPDDLATIIYTSGTTGPPKGAMLTHGNLCFTAHAAVQVVGHGADEVSVVYLPQAHALQRFAGYVGILTGATAYFATSIQTVMDDIRDVEPTVQVSVPRIWEKMHARILERVAAAPPRRQRIFAWALEVGREAAALERQGRPLPLTLRARHAVARRVVHDPLKKKVFGRRVRYLTSGGAPIGRDLLEFFHAVGILILEGWGLTETAAPATVNRPDAYRFGTVGRPLPGVEVEVAADGELLVRGPGVFQGYHRDAEATAAAFDERGFFRTGDLGAVDADGYVRITDRKKDIIVLAAGKNVAPQNLESHFKGIPLLDQALVVGDGRPYLVGLFSLDPEEALRWARAEGLLPPPAGAEPEDEQAARVPELLALPRLREHLAREIERKNAELARFEQLKRWEVVPERWTLEAGVLTPTLKLKRRVLHARYAELIEGLYA